MVITMVRAMDNVLTIVTAINATYVSCLSKKYYTKVKTINKGEQKI